MTTHAGALAALLNGAGIVLYDSDTSLPRYDPANWVGPWTEAQQDAWSLQYPYAILVMTEPVPFSQTLGRALRLPVVAHPRITIASEDSEEARDLLRESRAVLDRARPVVAGFSTTLRLRPEMSLDVIADRSVTLPGQRHPFYGVDVYRYDATPT